MKLVIFEDSKFDNLYPLTYTRPTFELRCGATSLAEKIRHAAAADSVAFFVRDYLRDSYAEKVREPVNDLSTLAGDVLFVNGRLLADGRCDLRALGQDQALKSGETLVAAKVRSNTLLAAKADSFAATLATLERKLHAKIGEATMIDYPWLLVRYNAQMIKSDFKRLYPNPGVKCDLHPLACVLGDESNVYIAPSVKIAPTAVIDATKAPVILEENVKVLPHTRVDGPTYVGPDTHLCGGKIREGCSFGPVCRIGGEVECTVIQGYSNKYHDGFLGHSYVGEWVNIGAMTTNSDLKNDYTTVSVQFKGQLTDTGEQFLGAMIGDHTKTSIGTILNTGSMIGMMSNLVFSGQLMPKFIPSFCWMLNNRPTKGVGLRAMFETARAAMKRRDKVLSPADEALIRNLHDMLKDELHEAIKKAFARRT